jgi:phosphotransferase system HPr (HPr) family protein
MFERSQRAAVYRRMRMSKVTVPWAEGLHFRQAARLVKAARNFRSSIRLKCGDRIADLRSILSVLALCAAMGMTLEVEVTGDDESDAAQTVEQIFLS